MNFIARVVRGNTTTQGNSSQSVGVGGLENVEAENKVDAFVKLYRKLSQNDHDVTIIKLPNSQTLTEDEIREVEKQGISVKNGMPKSGFQIEFIVEEEEFQKKYAHMF